MWLHWVSESGKARRHAPDFFVRRADGAAVLVDVRPYDRISAADSAVFAETAVMAGRRPDGKPNVVAISASAVGAIIAPPMPCTARAASSQAWGGGKAARQPRGKGATAWSQCPQACEDTPEQNTPSSLFEKVACLEQDQCDDPSGYQEEVLSPTEQPLGRTH
jgi:hypothetical protein